MIEAYKIATNMTITGDAHKKMIEFAKSVDKAARGTDHLQKMLRLVNKSMVTFNRELDKANPNLSKLTRTFSMLGIDLKSTNRSMDYFNESLIGVGGNTIRLKHETDMLRNSMNSLNHSSRQARASVASVGRQRVRGAITGGSGIGSTQAGLMGMAGGAIAHRFAPAALAYGAFNFGKSAFEQHAEYSRSIAQLEQMGLSTSQISHVKEITGNFSGGASPQTQIEAFVAAQMATQDPKRAEKLMPVLVRGTLAAQRIYGGMSHKQVEQAIRAAEVLGGSDENLVSNRLEDIFNMVALSGGSLMPNSVRQLVRKSPNLTRQGLLSLEPVAQELGGDVTSTGLRSGMAQFMKGQMTKPVAQRLQSYGILKAIRYDKLGHPVGSKYGDLKDEFATQLLTDPFQFLKSMRGIYASRGITKNEDINKNIYFDFQRTFADVLVSMNKAFEKTERIIANMKNLPGTSETSGGAEGVASQKLTESWKNFKNAMGNFSDPSVIKGMNLLSNILDKFAALLNVATDERQSGQMANMTKAALGFGSMDWAKSKPIILNVDGKRIATAIVPHMTGNGMQEYGTTQLNPIHSGMSTAPNTVGGTNS